MWRDKFAWWLASAALRLVGTAEYRGRLHAAYSRGLSCKARHQSDLDLLEAEFRLHALEAEQEGLVEQVDEAARASERERIAQAIEAHKLSQQTGFGGSTFGSTEPSWIGDYFYDEAAAIARAEPPSTPASRDAPRPGGR